MSTPQRSRRAIAADQAARKKENEDREYMFANPPKPFENYEKTQAAAAAEARQFMFHKHDPNCCDLLTAKAKDAIEGINSLIDKLTQAYNPNPNGAKTKTDGGKKSRKSHNSKKSRKSKKSRTTYKRSRR